MASATTAGLPESVLIERTDIHKSCKALETVVNLFNDYCQASEALALIQKKLSKALKDAAGAKATNQLAGDAFNASAFLLESLSEVDALFVKAADKECEMASGSLKKWFKKLAKDEKEHDKRVAAANAKIKQAGEVFEKKAKKKDLGAAEAHSQYVQLLGAVGPQIVEEKQNHTVSVTQLHTSATYTIALCISRAADAEWSRACGSVSKVAPLIGRVGELRAYLDGGWAANIPLFFKSDDKLALREERNSSSGSERVDEMGVRVASSSAGTETDASAHYSSAPALGTPAMGTYSATAGTPRAMSSPSIPLTPPTSAGTSLPARTKPSTVNAPPSSYFPHTLEKLHTDSVRSIESLSSFPAPPTHFPLPSMTPFPSSPLAQKPDDEHTELAPSKSSPANSALLPPASIDTDRTLTSSPLSMEREREIREMDGIKDAGDKLKAPESKSPLTSHRRRSSAQIGLTSLDSHPQERKSSGSGEFGRSDSVLSTNSIVASMRDKFDQSESKDIAQQVPRERDTPRLTNKVADLASRYVSSEPSGSGSLAAKPSSPTSDRTRQTSGLRTDGSSPGASPLPTRQSLGHSPSTSLVQVPSSTSVSSANLTPTDSQGAGQTPSEIDISRRRKRLEELEDLDRREQAMALRAREREIDLRSQALERERERIRAQSNATATESKSGRIGAVTASAIRQHNQHSYSMTNLAQPRTSADGAVPRPVTQYGDPAALAMSGSQSTSSSDPRPSDHAPHCGCHQCSAAQYDGSRPRASSNANAPGASLPHNQFSHIQVVPTPRTQKDKVKGGWMRRLSMPAVSAAFSSDSKKTPSMGYGLGAGIGRGPGVSPGLGPGIGYSTATGMHAFTSDSTGGISNVLVRPRKLSLGRR